MASISLLANKRKITGRKVKQLRQEGFIPANIFGKDIKSLSVQVASKDFSKVFGEAGETNIIELSVDKDKRPVLISQIQYHPVTNEILHVDFRQVDLTKKITAMVPLELVGESPAEKAGTGTVVSSIDEIEVEALPTDLPDKFEIDMSVLANVDDTIKVGDIKYDSKKITVLEDKDHEVARVEPPQKEEVIEVPAAPAEGEVPAEGGEAPVPAEEGEEKPQEETKEE